MISIIVATSPSGIIAIDGKIPWKCSSDMKHFKKTTLGSNVIMGRKTWDTLGNIPLVGRNNFVITRNIPELYNSSNSNSINYSNSIKDAMHKSFMFAPNNETFIIGGSEIYNQCLQECIVDRIYLSIINDKLIDSYDTNSDIKFFKSGKFSKWKKIQSQKNEEFELFIFDKIK